MPTTVARWWSLQRPRDDLRGRRGVAVDEHHERDLRGDRVAGGAHHARRARPAPASSRSRPSRGTCSSTSCASLTRPPRLPRRSSTIPLAPLRSSECRADATSACTPGTSKVGSEIIPSVTPCTLVTASRTSGVLITRRISENVSGRAPRRTPSVTCVPARPRISGTPCPAPILARSLPSTATIRSPTCIPARGRGPAGKHARDEQAGVDRHDVDPDAGELLRRAGC